MNIMETMNSLVNKQKFIISAFSFKLTGSGYCFYCISLFICLAFISGCMPSRPLTDPSMDQEALNLLLKARRRNNPYVNAAQGKGWAAQGKGWAVQGKGWLKFETDKLKESFRVVWAAAYPDKARIVLLSYGSPIETIIVNHEQISFLSHTGKHGLHTRKAKDMSLEPYVGIPVRISELILILLGNLPVTGGEDVYFLPEDKSMSTIVVHEKSKARKLHIKFDSDEKINCIQFRHSSGELLYEIQILKYSNFTFGNIPVQLEIKDMQDRKLFIEITNFTPKENIKDKVFQLTE